mgnify:FL=1
MTDIRERYDRAQTDLYGLGTALITPFKSDLSIDYEALDRLLDIQLSGDTDYIVVLGTTGEAATLTDDEKTAVREFIVHKVAGRLPLVLGVGGNCTARVVDELHRLAPVLAEHFTAILSVCPYYNKPSQEGIYRHFCTIAEASPVPVLLYNVPGRTGVNITPETVLHIHSARPDKVCGIKEASGNVPQIEHLLRQAPSDFLVISGDDGIACQLMEAGASGLISVAGNAFPAVFRKIIYDKDSALQARYAQMVHLLFAEGNPSGIKTVLAEQGIISNYLRLPLVSNSDAIQTEIRCALRSLTD